MRATRAARRRRGKRAWRRDALRAVERARRLDREGFPAETIAATLRLSPGLVPMMLAEAGAHGEQGGG